MLGDIMIAVLDALRSLMLTFCNMIFNIIGFLFDAFEFLGSSQIFQEDAYVAIYTRIGIILGLFMAFRMSFAFIQYIIDPEQMKDSKKGVGSLVKKALIMVVLLGSTNYLFTLAYEVQYRILDEEIIPRIILGKSATVGNSNAGVKIAKELFFTGFTLDEYLEENPDTEVENDMCIEYYRDNVLQAAVVNRGNLKIVFSCVNQRYTYTDNLAKFNGNEKDLEAYQFDFTGGGFLSLILLCVAAYTIFIYTIQVGVRTIQLAYLEIIAPIPIMSYLMPSGEEKLKKWGKQCLSTFLDLFIRYAIMYFAIFLIETILDDESLIQINLSGTSFLFKTYVIAILILAIMIFAKKIPKLLEELFPSLGASGLGFDLSFKKNVAEPIKDLYNSPLGWGLKLGKNAIGAIDRKIYNLPKPRNKIQQGIDKLMPGRAEVIKNRAEGRKEVIDIDAKWNDGADRIKKLVKAGTFTAYGSTTGTSWDKALDGRTKSNYEKFFKNKEFIESKMHLDKEKKELEDLRDGLASIQSGGAPCLINGQAYSLSGGTVTIGGTTYAAKSLQDLSKDYNSKNSTVTNMEKVHDSIRKQYADDAKVEDQYKFLKNNATNPANTSQTHGTRGI